MFSIYLPNCTHYADLAQLFEVEEALKLPCPAEVHLFLALISQQPRHAENASITLHDVGDDDDDDECNNVYG